MRKSVRIVLIVATLGIAAGAVGVSAQVPLMKTVMRHKLESMQELLKAVVTSDFAQVDRSAERLSRITEMEIVSWQTPGQPEYTRQAVLFLSSVEGLRQAARQRDADAAGDHYATLVSSCVRCHAVGRRARLISATK